MWAPYEPPVIPGPPEQERKGCLAFIAQNPRVLFAGFVFAFIITLAGIMFYGTVAPASQAHRTKAITVMRAEVARLTPYPGSQVTSDTELSADRFVPSLNITYSSSPDQCSAIQQYYESQARRSGWSVNGLLRSNSLPFDALVWNEIRALPNKALTSEYQKVVQGYTLDMTIDCSVGPGSSDYYELYMSTT